jgi:hypothetical protein
LHLAADRLKLRERYRWDLREGAVKNDATLGAAFRSYFLFLDQVGKTKDAAARFYRLLPAAGRNLVSQDPFTLEKLHRLFLSVSNEFMEAYELKGYSR